jgi:exodeoxyribonuclease-3
MAMTAKILRLISWNVNGLRAVMKKGFPDALERLNADVVGIQETKLQESQVTEAMKSIQDYRLDLACATHRKGYSGVATFYRKPPEAICHGLGVDHYDQEGRIQELDFGDFVLFNVYFPNGQSSDERLQYKLDFYRDFFARADDLKNRGRHVIVSGDFNTAHNEIDLKNPGPNSKRSGFLRIERDWLDQVCEGGWVDTFRHLYPETVTYSWWSYRFNARKNNAGWRIDYFFVSQSMFEAGMVKDAFIATDFLGSDHCPVGLDLQIP